MTLNFLKLRSGKYKSTAVTPGEPLPVLADANWVPVGFTRVVSIDTVAAGITSPPAGVCKAVIQAEGQTVRYRDDGVDPTASVGWGILVAAGGQITYIGDLSKLKFLAATAGGWVNISMYGPGVNAN